MTTQTLPAKKPLSSAVAGAMAFKGLDNWFEIFVGGEQTDSQGRTRTFSEADLDSIVANHKPAPLVVGHPKDVAPAFGWTTELKRDGLTLFAKAGDLHAGFVDAVKNRNYPERSVSLEADGSGGLKLRHIGFLGGVAPAIEGMESVFSSTENAQVFEFAVSDFSTDSRTAHQAGFGLSSVASLFRSLREYFIQETSIEDADRLIPQYHIDELRDGADRLIRTENEPVSQYSQSANSSSTHQSQPAGGDMPFSKEELDKAVADAVADANARAEAAEAKAAEQLASAAFAADVAKNQVLIEQLTKEGKLLPAQTGGLAEFMAGLSADQDSVFEFSVANGKGQTKQEQKSPLQFMQDFMASLGTQVKLGRDDQSEPERTSHEFSAPSGYSVSEDRAAMHNKAMDYSRKHNCSYEQAIQIVSEE